MTLPLDIRQFVRERARYACEYCGVQEIHAASELTIDHFHPRSLGGSNHPDNLLYCCPRCNLNKLDYWFGAESEFALWNPRTSSSQEHMVLLADGTLRPLTQKGRITIDLLRLNRPQLIDYRTELQSQREALRVTDELRATIATLEQTNRQQQKLILAQQHILRQQELLIRALLSE